MSIYKIQSAAFKKDVQLAHGTFKSYRITVEHEGENIDAEILQKPESPAPVVGEDMDLTLTKGEYGWKAKRVPKAFGGAARVDNPDQRKSIERQTSLIQAVLLANGQMSVTGKKVSSIEVLKVADLFVDWLTEHKTLPVALRGMERKQEMDQPFPEDDGSQELSDEDLERYGA